MFKEGGSHFNRRRLFFRSEELLKKYRSLAERGFLVFWRGFGEGACLKTL
jgi:hypothetical protein